MQLVHFQLKVTAYIVSWFEEGQLQKTQASTKKTILLIGADLRSGISQGSYCIASDGRLG